SPLLEHDSDGRFLGRLVFILTDELDLPLKSGGTATIRSRLRERGIEADECFWIANAARMAGRRRLDLDRDPPPGLALEIDVTSSSLDRLAIYAALRVPEIWHLASNTLTFYALSEDGTYVSVGRSVSFPQVTPTDLLGF